MSLQVRASGWIEALEGEEEASLPTRYPLQEPAAERVKAERLGLSDADFAAYMGGNIARLIACGARP